MRTITLELLRHGPAHNQLLSPLTPYLALCENHPAVTLHLPFEHNQFMHRLTALTYKARTEEARVFQLQDTARLLGEILSEIPGLTAESSRESGDGGGDAGLTHLRLILSSSELALLPFELALSPNGFPGTGQHLLLQPQMPICLTREVRRVPGEQWEWPRKPRILFVAAAPAGTPDERGVGAIPLESHLLALRRVIGPWVKFYDAADEQARAERVAEHLVLLPRASIEAIERECATGKYTHVHILAHGVEREEGFDRRFYLALHDANDPARPDFISGPRLATALRAAQRPDARGLARPAVVTLASCDSGNVGSVAGAGASIAHALHEAGIPVVVAGQFPLSFQGSVRLVETLYEGMLWGTDPRRLLHDLRRRLYAQFRETHDWASLTAYLSLPPDFEEQLNDIQIQQAMNSINAAMNHVDQATLSLFVKHLGPRAGAQTGAPAEPEKKDRASRDEKQKKHKELLDAARAKLRPAKAKLERLLECIPSKRSEIYGLIASTEKRQAEMLYSGIAGRNAREEKAAEEAAAKPGANGSAAAPKDRRTAYVESWQELLKARDHYWESFVLDRSNSWAVIQYLSLALVIRHGRKETYPPLSAKADGGQGRPEKDWHALWSLAHLLARYDLQSQGREVPAEAMGRHKSSLDLQKGQRKLAIWAHGNLLELYLLWLVMEPRPDLKELGDPRRLAVDHADSLIDLAGRHSFAVYSTRRQIFRYLNWFRAISDIEPMIKTAQAVFNRFPAEVEESWK